LRLAHFECVRELFDSHFGVNIQHIALDLDPGSTNG